MQVTVIPIVISVLGTVNKDLLKGTGDLGNKRTCGDHSNNSIVENTEKSPGDLRRLAHTDSCEKPSAIAGVKNFQMSKIIMYSKFYV